MDFGLCVLYICITSCRQFISLDEWKNKITLQSIIIWYFVTTESKTVRLVWNPWWGLEFCPTPFAIELIRGLVGLVVGIRVKLQVNFIGTRIWKPLNLQLRGWKMRGSAATLGFRCTSWWFPDWHFRQMTQSSHLSKMCFPCKIHV